MRYLASKRLTTKETERAATRPVRHVRTYERRAGRVPIRALTQRACARATCGVWCHSRAFGRDQDPSGGDALRGSGNWQVDRTKAAGAHTGTPGSTIPLVIWEDADDHILA